MRCALLLIAAACSSPASESRDHACASVADRASAQLARLLAGPEHDEVANVLRQDALAYPWDTPASIRDRLVDSCRRWTPAQLACARGSDVASVQFQACVGHDEARSQADTIRNFAEIAKRWRLGAGLASLANSRCVLTGESVLLHVYATPPAPDQIPFDVRIAAKGVAGWCEIAASLRRDARGAWQCESATVACDCMPVSGADGCRRLEELCAIEHQI